MQDARVAKPRKKPPGSARAVRMYLRARELVRLAQNASQEPPELVSTPDQPIAPPEAPPPVVRKPALASRLFW